MPCDKPASSWMQVQIQKEATNNENQTYMMRQQLEQAKAAADAQLARSQQEADARLAAELTSASASARDTGLHCCNPGLDARV